MPTYYSLQNNVIVNKITKTDYDLYVAAGIITQDMIDNQAWIFTDDNFLSADNLAKLNALTISDINKLIALDASEIGGIKGVKFNGTDLTPDENGVVSINVVVPTKVSDLENDSGFITNTVDNLANYYKKTEVNALISTLNALNIEVVSVLPTDNISTHTLYLVPKSTVLASNVYNEYIYVNSGWELLGDTAVDLSGYYNKTEVDALLANKANTSDIPTVPTKVSDLENDSGFITGYTESDPTVPAWAKEASKPTYTYDEITDKPTLSAVATSGSYNDLSDKPTIPEGSCVLRIWNSGVTE